MESKFLKPLIFPVELTKIKGMFLFFWIIFRGNKEVSLFKSSKFNVFNSGNWEQPITRGDLIIFPAHVLHQICLNNSKNTRYSIAANFLPKGKIGERDGELILT